MTIKYPSVAKPAYLKTLSPFLTVEVEVAVAVQLLYRYLYKKLHTCAILTNAFFWDRQKSSTLVLKTEGEKIPLPFFSRVGCPTLLPASTLKV